MAGRTVKSICRKCAICTEASPQVPLQLQRLHAGLHDWCNGPCTHVFKINQMLGSQALAKTSSSPMEKQAQLNQLNTVEAVVCFGLTGVWPIKPWLLSSIKRLCTAIVQINRYAPNKSRAHEGPARIRGEEYHLIAHAFSRPRLTTVCVTCALQQRGLPE